MPRTKKKVGALVLRCVAAGRGRPPFRFCLLYCAKNAAAIFTLATMITKKDPHHHNPRHRHRRHDHSLSSTKDILKRRSKTIKAVSVWLQYNRGGAEVSEGKKFEERSHVGH